MPDLADRQFRRQYRKKHKLDTRLAFLGDNNNPARVRVPGRPNMVYVRYPASTSNTDNLAWPTVVKMDRNLTDAIGTGVVVGYDDEGDIAVLKLSTKTAEATGNTSQQGTVNNPVNQWVDLNFSPLLRVQPMGAGAPLFLSMLGFPYIDKDGTFHDFRGISGGMDCSSFIPGSAGQWRLIAPWLKTDDTHEITASTVKSQLDPFVAADLQELVDARSTDSLPTSVWILKNGQTIFADTDKYLDWRQWLNLPQSGSTSALTVDDGTTTVTDVVSITFNGADFTVTDLTGGAVQIDAISGGSASLYIMIQDQQTQNTNGGTFTNGAWRTRVLNTIVTDDTGAVSLSANQFTLPAGTYRIRASAPSYETNRHQTRLYNISDSTVTLIGTSEFSPAGTAQTRSYVDGQFTITGSKTFELQHIANTTGTTFGFGIAANFTTEIYAVVELEKVS